MDYSKFSKTNNIVTEFIDLVNIDQNLAVGYMDNLLGILLSKEIGNEHNNILMYAIKYGKEKVAMDIIDKNVLDLNDTNVKNENAFLLAAIYGQYKVAIKILDSGMSNAAQKNKHGYEAIEYIKFDNGVKNDPKKNEKIELLIKLLNYYIENNITITEPFQSTIDFICNTPDLLEELKKTFEENKNLKINKKKFKQYIRLDKRNILCVEPVAAEAGDLITDLEIVSNVGSRRRKKPGDLKAKVINKKKPAIALPDTDDYFDENEYDSEEEEEFLITPRNYSAGKSKSKKNKRKGKTRKLR